MVGRKKKEELPLEDQDSQKLDRAEQELLDDLAEKVRFLFEHCRKPNLDRYTYKEVEELTGGAVHASWISRLASGYSQRPGLMALKALTDFFKIDPSFWFNPLDDISKYRIKTEKGDSNLPLIALRSSNLSPEDVQVVLDLINSLERAEREASKRRQS